MRQIKDSYGDVLTIEPCHGKGESVFIYATKKGHEIAEIEFIFTKKTALELANYIIEMANYKGGPSNEV
jgi:hypothetical protein